MILRHSTSSNVCNMLHRPSHVRFFDASGVPIVLGRNEANEAPSFMS